MIVPSQSPQGGQVPKSGFEQSARRVFPWGHFAFKVNYDCALSTPVKGAVPNPGFEQSARRVFPWGHFALKVNYDCAIPRHFIMEDSSTCVTKYPNII
jgi:hypothetical protein